MYLRRNAATFALKGQKFAYHTSCDRPIIAAEIRDIIVESIKTLALPRVQRLSSTDRHRNQDTVTRVSIDSSTRDGTSVAICTFISRSWGSDHDDTCSRLSKIQWIDKAEGRNEKKTTVL